MKVPRMESKLRVFSFKIQFKSQVVELYLSFHNIIFDVYVFLDMISAYLLLIETKSIRVQDKGCIYPDDFPFPFF